MKRILHVCLSLSIFLIYSEAQQPATAPDHAATHHTATQSTPSADKLWTELMQGNQRFVAGTPKIRPLVRLRESLAKSQHPNIVVLTCSDSRVSPEVLFDQSLGDLFVVRSAGNIADPIGVGSIEYAFENLGSSVLVVLGHSKCGAVNAACSGKKMPTSNLQAIVDRIEPAVTEASKSAKGDALLDAAIKQNVHQSAHDVLASSTVLQHFKDDGKLTVFEAEYDLDTGKVTRLDSAH